MKARSRSPRASVASARSGKLAPSVFADGLIGRAEERRRSVSGLLDASERAKRGQFFTPAPVAVFIADLLALPKEGTLRLLDPGAGVGSLTAAVIERVIRERLRLHIDVVAIELDEALIPHLVETLRDCEVVGHKAGVAITTDVRQEDFIAWASSVATGSLMAVPETFSACVMNPPYRKVNNGGRDRRALERVGVRVTNLYTAFLALAAELLEPGGQLAAITPRSFANGPYHKSFREFFLSRMSLDRLHVYERRGELFADAEVLQENVVIKATRQGQRKRIALSTSRGAGDRPIARSVPYEEVVRPHDPHHFIHIPIDEQDTVVADRVASLPATISDLHVEVSTGRVVDFRSRQYLRDELEPGSVPLIYPNHLRNRTVVWPQPDSRKPNAFAVTDASEPLTVPKGNYVLVKRFTAKEEPRRLVAAVYEAEAMTTERVAFENHINFFHEEGAGLPLDLARGLALYLSSTLLDTYFRQFSGHTQVNAADLRSIRYPSRQQLRAAGRAVDPSASTQEEIDQAVERFLLREQIAQSLAAVS